MNRVHTKLPCTVAVQRGLNRVTVSNSTPTLKVWTTAQPYLPSLEPWLKVPPDRRVTNQRSCVCIRARVCRVNPLEFFNQSKSKVSQSAVSRSFPGFQESLHFKVETSQTTSDGEYALLARRNFSSPSEVFQQFISPKLINFNLDDRQSDTSMTDLEVFVLDTGHGKSSCMKVSVPMWQFVKAGMVWIRGEQKQAGYTVKLAIKSALEFLQERNPSDWMGVDCRKI